MTNKRINALKLARNGFRVFPLIENSKLPAIKDFPNQATVDETRISAWWDARPDANIGIATGEDLAVVDYDTKQGKQGGKALEFHTAFDLPPTFGVVTATGGYHLYFRPSRTLPNSTSRIARDVDIRGHHGFVVAPGSTINGATYRAGSIPTVADMPDWMENLALKHRPSSLPKQTQTPSIPLDLPSQIEKAKHWLQNEAPEAIEGAGGDETTYRVAAKLRELALTPETALDLLLEWNAYKAIPPWSPDELRKKIENAFKYGKLQPGSTSAMAEFPSVPSPRPSGLYYVHMRDGAARAHTFANKPLIRGLLDAGTLSCVYGRSNSGKTFVALDLAYHVATGKDWNGLHTTQGAVLYIAAEGGAGVFKRLAALERTHGPADTPLAIIPCPVDLLHGSGPDSDTRHLVDLVKQYEAETHHSVKMLVIDTLSRALAGGDENSSVDMGAFIKHIDNVRTAIGAHICIVHHSGKDAARGARGWSGIQAALDTEIEIRDNILSVTKQRDLEKNEQRRFDLRSIDLGTTPDGHPVSSCTVTWRDTKEFGVQALTPAEEDMLAAAQSLNLAEFATERWESAYKEQHPNAGHAPRRIREMRQALVDKGCVRRLSKTEWAVTDDPLTR